MKTVLILFLELFISSPSYTQSKDTWDKNQICRQISSSIDYLEREKGLGYFKIKSNKILRYGWGYSFMTTEYAAGRLNVDKEKLWEQQDKERINELFKYISDVEIDKVTLDLGFCGKLKHTTKDSNTTISKLDNESLLYYLTTKKSGKFGSSGFIYLFFFDDSDKIVRTYKTDWIE